MKRDDEFLRELLLRLEADDNWIHLLPATTLNHTQEEAKARYHLELANDIALVTLHGEGTFRLTAQGHDYLDAIRDEGIWNKTKEAVAETGGNVTLEILSALAKGFLKKKISKHTGIEL